MQQTISSFVLYSVVLAMIPGPDNMFVFVEAATRGARAGLMITLGLCAGLLIHTTAVVIGLAAVVSASPLAFTAIKLVGTAYLVYLAWNAFRARPEDVQSAATDTRSGAGYFRRGIIMNATNPKVAMFFLAFLPQFTDLSRGSVKLQLLMLGGIFIFCTFVVFALVAVSAGRLSDILFRTSKTRLLLNKVAGAIFLLLAARLLTEHQ